MPKKKKTSIKSALRSKIGEFDRIDKAVNKHISDSDLLSEFTISENRKFMIAQAQTMAQQERNRLIMLESVDRVFAAKDEANHEFLPKADERNSGCNAPSGQPTKAQLIASPSISEKTRSPSISEKTLIRIMDQAGVERRLNDIEPKMRRFWPDEIDRMIVALEKGNFNQHEELIKKFLRWASQPKH